MGCDITMVVEARRDDGAWQRIDMRRPCPFCKGERIRKDGGRGYRCPECDVLGQVADFDWRDYRLFHRLAGVRGFDVDHKPIAEPRGVPDDASASTREELADLHSCSWLLLSEAMAGTQDFEGAMWRGFLDTCQERGAGITGTRLVFGFDS